MRLFKKFGAVGAEFLACFVWFESFMLKLRTLSESWKVFVLLDDEDPEDVELGKPKRFESACCDMVWLDSKCGRRKALWAITAAANGSCSSWK